MRYKELLEVFTINDDLIDQVQYGLLNRGFEIPLTDDGEEDRDFLHAMISQSYLDIKSNIKGNNLLIYRAIDIKDISELKQNIGIYWSTEKSTAHPYNGNPSNNYWLLLTALVSLNYISIEEILPLHIMGGENEVRLEKNTPIEIISSEWVSHEHIILPKTRIHGNFKT